MKCCCCCCWMKEWKKREEKKFNTMEMCTHSAASSGKFHFTVRIKKSNAELLWIAWTTKQNNRKCQFILDLCAVRELFSRSFSSQLALHSSIADVLKWKFIIYCLVHEQHWNRVRDTHKSGRFLAFFCRLLMYLHLLFLWMFSVSAFNRILTEFSRLSMCFELWNIQIISKFFLFCINLF